jgi:hypothetical protein
VEASSCASSSSRQAPWYGCTAIVWHMHVAVLLTRESSMQLVDSVQDRSLGRPVLGHGPIHIEHPTVARNPTKRPRVCDLQAQWKHRHTASTAGSVSDVDVRHCHGHRVCRQLLLTPSTQHPSSEPVIVATWPNKRNQWFDSSSSARGMR